MAEVHIVDIDGEQWDIKDLPLTSRVAILETKFSEMKSMRRNLSVQPSSTPSCLWDCILKVIPAIDWSFITTDVWAYGVLEVKSVCLGTYEAIRHSGNWLEVRGTLTYDGKPHVFSAFYNVQSSLWDYQADGEAFAYLQNNILATQTVNRQNNGFSVPAQIFIRNIAETTIGNLYAALSDSGLLNRPSVGGVLWDLQRNHNGVDLPKGRIGYPAYASSSEYEFSGRIYLQNPRIGTVDPQSNAWIFNWSDGNSYADANMYGEPGTGIVKTVSIMFTV